MPRSVYRADLLVAGGAYDPNLHAVAAAAAREGLTVAAALHAPDQEPALAWSFDEDALILDGCRLDITGAFLRYDVFNPAAGDPMRVDRSMAWYTAVAGYLQASPEIASFNRRPGAETANKPAFLARACKAGLPVPRTLLTNDRREIEAFGDEAVVKPAAGGAYCVTFAEVADATQWNGPAAPAPVFVQERLNYPEFRVFVVGDVRHVFEIRADALDHRADRESDVRHVPERALPDPDIGARLTTLARDIGLDFCAFDLKTRPSDGALCVLEVNSGPMFAAFDQTANGDLTRAIARHLTGNRPRPG